MASTLQQILRELAPAYNPQVKQLRSRQALIPGQIQAEEQGLQAKQTQAFGDILGGARQRGLGFSGIPLAEQAKYTSTEFLPALARLKQGGREQAMSLEDAILGIGERKNTLAQQLLQQYKDRRLQQQQFQESKRQFNLSLEEQRRAREAAARSAAASNSFAVPSLGGGGGGNTQKAPKASFAENAPGSFQFVNRKGAPITAAQYAQAQKVDLRDVLKYMGQRGDRTAALVYNQLANAAQTPGVSLPETTLLKNLMKQYPQLLKGFKL